MVPLLDSLPYFGYPTDLFASGRAGSIQSFAMPVRSKIIWNVKSVAIMRARFIVTAQPKAAVEVCMCITDEIVGYTIRRHHDPKWKRIPLDSFPPCKNYTERGTERGSDLDACQNFGRWNTRVRRKHAGLPETGQFVLSEVLKSGSLVLLPFGTVGQVAD
ncbi:hypothetical protein M404DRAFT_453897 [Pisolithus tinctorius Marx 270]|uniref:Uncharacterized protein n=1 Tax=Pisolithus tinctorius Marx 270 TaxID=870435 RepID=A0A0C3PIM9_PISTI|nr:hypothetical protein M404DRAFT_453897 [Pisolithus tinctorius Marx 270]